MFSSISSYIWGSESTEEASGQVLVTPPRSPSPEGANEGDWVLVGPSPAPGDLAGALEPLPVSPASSSGTSTPASSEESEMEDVEVEVGSTSEPLVVNRGRPNNPATRVQALAARELKQVKQSQILKQRSTGKALSSKALKRNNKTMMVEQGKKSFAKQNFNIKMAGNNKNLKQC